MFFPDEDATAHILTHYAKALADKYDVHVICASPLGQKKEIEDFTVHRLKVPRLDKNSLVKRTLKFVYLSLLMTLVTLFRCGRKSKVFVVTNPAMLIPGIAVVKALKRFNLTILVHDVFPENTLAAGIVSHENGLAYRCLKKVFDVSYRAADKLLVLGRDMKEVMHGKTHFEDQRIEIVENWAEPTVGYQPALRPSAGPVVLQYAGNIGRVQGLMQFVELFAQAANPNVRLEIWGRGAMESQLREYVEKQGIENVVFGGSYKRSEQPELLNKCDLALITLSNRMYGLGVPSKSYNIIASGSPILCIGDKRSEISRTVSENEIGFCFETGDRQGIVNFLKSLSRETLPALTAGMAEREQELCRNKYSQAKIFEKITFAI